MYTNVKGGSTSVSMLGILKKLFQATGEGYADERIPASNRRKPASGTSPSRRPSSGKRKSGTASAARRKTGTVSSSAQIYGEQSIFANPAARMYQIPQQIRQMRTLSGYDNLTGARSMESLFYQQGKFMEQYTDDFHEPVQCGRSTPMYYNMKDNELRAYFTWRTLYRQGALPETQPAFLLLYAYEILNLIGFSAAEPAYEALGSLLRDYGEAYPAVKKQILRWMPDFAAFYHLPYRLEDEREAAAITVLRHSAHTAEELLLALDALSKYHIKDSKLYLANPAQTAEILKSVYGMLLMHYAEQKKQSYCAYLLGEQQRREHILFEGAVFCCRTTQPDGAYRLSPLCVYHCYKGKWAKEIFCSDPHPDRVGAMLRTFDAMLREKINFKGKLKQGELPEGDAEIIRLAIDAYFEEQRRKNAPVITLDADELEQIRAAAEHTTDMLTLPEDAEAVVAPIVEQTDADDDDDAVIPDLPLSAPAMALLICLVTGESWQPLLDAGQMLSVLADEINENLYDQIGDTLIDMQDDGTPVLIEDYLEDVKGLLET